MDTLGNPVMLQPLFLDSGALCHKLLTDWRFLVMMDLKSRITVLT